MNSRPDWPNVPPSWPPSGSPLETERRLTRLEMGTDQHGRRLDSHDTKHDHQEIWNKAVAIALAGLASGLAHAKAGDLVDFLLALLKGFKP